MYFRFILNHTVYAYLPMDMFTLKLTQCTALIIQQIVHYEHTQTHLCTYDAGITRMATITTQLTVLKITLMGQSINSE